MGAHVYMVAFSPDGQKVLTASGDRTAALYDAQTGVCELKFAGHTQAVYMAAFSPDAKQVLTASHDKTARLYDAVTGECVQVFRGHSDRVYMGCFFDRRPECADGIRRWNRQTVERKQR